MISYIKKNSSLIIKFIVNQIALTLFGLVLYLSTYQTEWLAVASSVFSILFYSYLLINASVDYAKQEKLRIDAGRAEYKPFEGAKIWLCANILNIILALLIIIGKMFAGLNEGIAVGNIFEKLSVANECLSTSPSWAYNFIGVCQPIFNILNGMYMGVINTYAPQNSAAFLLALIPSFAAATFGYYAGIKNMPFTKIFDVKPKYKQ